MGLVSSGVGWRKPFFWLNFKAILAPRKLAIALLVPVVSARSFFTSFRPVAGVMIALIAIVSEA
jgi:hypothetical protein